MDRRIKYTKKIIKDSFIQLLLKKDINKITVSELCKKADINRATFYRYYLDIYNLLDVIKSDFVNELINSYQTNHEGTNSVYLFSKATLSIFLENKELVKILFSTDNNIYFFNSVLEYAYERCKEKWEKDLPDISIEDIEYAATFIFNGALGIVNFWVKNDFDKDIEELSKIIETLSYQGTNKYIYKNKTHNLI